MKLNGRAKMYSQALKVLSARQGLTGRCASVERGARYLSLGIRLADEMQIEKALKLAEPLALATNTPTVITKREGGLLLYQFELAPALWQKCNRSDLKNGSGRVGLGLSDGQRQIDFAFDTPHCLVAGTTGSGKSETVRSILTGLFTAYQPTDLQAVIVDPDGDYADDFRNCAHLAGVAIASEAGEINQAINYAHQEYATRTRENRRDASRLVLVVDEAEDVLHGERLEAVTAIARHGRKYNVNLLLATQRPTEKALPGLMDKVNQRYIGLCQTAAISAHLAGQSGLACHRLTGRGDFIRVAGAQVDRLLVAMATAQDIERLPRAELSAPEFEVCDPVVIDHDPVSTSGRPRAELSPEAIAYYLLNRPVSRKGANENLGLGQTLHARHREFSEAILAEIKRLLEVTNGRQK